MDDEEVEKQDRCYSLLKHSFVGFLHNTRVGIEFFGKHPVVAGLLALLSVAGLAISILGFELDRDDARFTTEQVANVDKRVEKIYELLQGTARDWHVMEKAFYGIRVGGPIQPAYDLEFERLLRRGDGVLKTIKWRLPNSNDFTVEYDSEQDRIRYIQIDWNGNELGKEVGISNFRFGETTLQDIRDSFDSNGFSYATHVMYKDDDGVVTFNAFELVETPTIIIVFKTLLPYEAKAKIDLLPKEKQLLGQIGTHFRLTGISVADETYLDDVWGEVKIYDPKSNPIALK